MSLGRPARRAIVTTVAAAIDARPFAAPWRPLESLIVGSPPAVLAVGTSFVVVVPRDIIRGPLAVLAVLAPLMVVVPPDVVGGPPAMLAVGPPLVMVMDARAAGEDTLHRAVVEA